MQYVIMIGLFIGAIVLNTMYREFIDTKLAWLKPIVLVVMLLALGLNAVALFGI